MIVAADCHVHFYPKYNLGKLLRQASTNLSYMAKSDSAIKLILLTERKSENVFSELIQLKSIPGSPELTIGNTSEPISLKVTLPDSGSIFVIAGTQINTAERIEVLSLACTERINDGLPIEQTIHAVQHAGGIPVVNWAPGKWSFNRGKIVGQLIENASPQNLVLCDTTLRPLYSPMPKLMRLAKRRNLRIIAGSDPFPFSGEEKHVGTYGIISEQQSFDSERPGSSIKDLILGSNTKFEIVGQRNTPIQVAYRIARLKTRG